jgi:hypothetical protein
MRVSPRIRLIVAAVLFLGWMAWLGYAALTKSRGPVVSRAQAAAATDAVEVRIRPGAPGEPEVVEIVRPLKGGLAKGAKVEVLNLGEAEGFDGEGDYLLLLVKDRHSDLYRVVGQQRSPGYETTGKPRVYPWSPDVEEQAKALFPQK